MPSDFLIFMVSYFRMRKVMDEALQRLYWACRRQQGFPGNLPDETKGPVTTAEILEGLGLIGREMDNFGHTECAKVANQTFTSPVGVHYPHAQRAQSTTSLPSPTDSKHGRESMPPSPLSILSPAMKREQTQLSSESTLPQLCISPNVEQEGQIGVTSNHMQSRATFETGAAIHQKFYACATASTPTSGPTHPQSQGDPLLNPDSFCDIKSWTAPVDHNKPHLSDLNLDAGGINQPLFEDQPVSDRSSCCAELSMDVYTNSPTNTPGMIGDGFLGPWPGTLEAAYQSLRPGTQS